MTPLSALLMPNLNYPPAAALRRVRSRRNPSSARPVCERRLRRAIWEGAPWATMRPPRSPASGPRSRIQSASAMMSRLCSTTTAVLPAATSRCSTWTSFSTSAAYVTQHLDVGEEAHLDGLHALACARLAAPAGGVEREAARGVAADARLGGAGVDAADVVPEADVGRGTGARGLADRCLIDLEHPVDVLEPAHGRTADELRGGGAPRPPARGSRLPEQPLQVRVQGVARHGGRARTRYGGNHDQTSERDAHVASPDGVPRHRLEPRQRRGGIQGAM